jgi:hypothetical protein
MCRRRFASGGGSVSIERYSANDIQRTVFMKSRAPSRRSVGGNGRILPQQSGFVRAGLIS